MNDKIIIGFPGGWESKEQIVRLIFDNFGSEFVYANNVISCEEKNYKAEMLIYGYDENLKNTFEFAGKGKISDYVLSKIASHKYTIYLKFDRGGDDLRDRISTFSEVIDALGGIAVKVETSGTAFEMVDWMQQLNSGEKYKFYNMLVTLVRSDKYYYSCGMQGFCIPDCTISTDIHMKDAVNLLNSINMYQINESPKFETGQAFSVDEGGPQYKMELKEDFIYGDDGFYVNSYGRWLLEKI